MEKQTPQKRKQTNKQKNNQITPQVERGATLYLYRPVGRGGGGGGGGGFEGVRTSLVGAICVFVHRGPTSSVRISVATKGCA